MSQNKSPKGTRKPTRPEGIPGDVAYDPRVSPAPSVSTTDFPSASFVTAQSNRRFSATRKTGNAPPGQLQTPGPSDLGDLALKLERSTLNSPQLASTPIKTPSSDNMSKAVTFSGKPSQLDPCLTFCRVHLQAHGVTDESAKAGFLASLLRGPALNWLSQQLKTSDSLLADYGELQARLKAAFALDDDARRLQAARQLTGLHQKGSVRDYALRFDALADEAGLNDATKIAYFTKGLKKQVRDAIIINANDDDSYTDIQTEATRIDSQFYYSSRHGQTRNDGKPRRGKDGRYKSNTPKTEPTW